MRSISPTKANGVHYTPPQLARFLAQAVWEHFVPAAGRIRVLDPACGDGALLRACAETAPRAIRKKLVLVGYETDPAALARAGEVLANVDSAELILNPTDFLSQDGVELEPDNEQPSLFAREPEDGAKPQFDVVIANPPYVRTQVLGSKRAQELARKFKLTGRVDLYHAFVKAMTSVLRPRGTLGLLTSNRFLVVQSGTTLRRLLSNQFDLKAIYDLGDTKLFAAAVLPVIVVAEKGSRTPACECTFDRVYESRGAGTVTADKNGASVLDALQEGCSGMVATGDGAFVIERGILSIPDDSKAPWFLETADNREWLATVRAYQACTFNDVGKIRVGIKTTADAVFIRDDWDSLPAAARPEAALLRPIITHDDASRWCLDPERAGSRRVLYPHRVRHGHREPVPLDAYPRARAYLEAHRARLTGRKYVVESGRQWYEIWVPQHPADWAEPKVVYPDIAENPRFFLDQSGAIVDGDCYWITLRAGQDAEWLLLMLAVANSSFITRYYDTVFHNKLYSGRRRFMAQYVKEFPLPRRESPAAQRLTKLLAKITKPGLASETVTRMEGEIDEAVWQSFCLGKEVAR